jgi:uncharacterized membrane protein YhaH (DUF805 family)
MAANVGLWEHFRRLATFRGREDRASFWPYAGLAFAILMAVGAAMFVPMMAQSMAAMQAFAAQHPDQVTVVSGPGEYSISTRGAVPGLMPSSASLLAYLGVTFGLALLLYAAAVVRRLHDRGRTGAWGLLPLPFILYSTIQMPRMFGAVGAGQQPDMGLFFSVFFSNLLYMASVLALIVLLAGPSDPQPNRYDLDG